MKLHYIGHHTKSLNVKNVKNLLKMNLVLSDIKIFTRSQLRLNATIVERNLPGQKTFINT